MPGGAVEKVRNLSREVVRGARAHVECPGSAHFRASLPRSCCWRELALLEGACLRALRLRRGTGTMRPPICTRRVCPCGPRGRGASEDCGYSRGISTRAPVCRRGTCTHLLHDCVPACREPSGLDIRGSASIVVSLLLLLLLGSPLPLHLPRRQLGRCQRRGRPP